MGCVIVEYCPSLGEGCSLLFINTRVVMGPAMVKVMGTEMIHVPFKQTL